ncbi:GAF domain-containing protein [Streptomyces sp. NBC_00247]|uniref:GAF domain-containing protein n=1 Tax=Streptomyces sp. NBC_00247 TaxID=2975689 RepID=UPI002E2D5C0A|nr:GAF domain-containing protein [Streptomyces sp. NBC_00247]
MSSAAEPAAHSAQPVALELLQSVVDVARAIFGAQASSVFLLDEETNELVFQAVSGQGEEFLVGRRFPADRGIAGWVVVSGEPMIVDRLSQNAAFDRDFARSTAYVPDALMAVPLLRDHQVLGVLEVLDPSPQARSSLGELDLLMMFARQAATALRLVTHHRPAAALALAPDDRATANRLLSQLHELLGPPGTP